MPLGNTCRNCLTCKRIEKIRLFFYRDVCVKTGHFVNAFIITTNVEDGELHIVKRCRR